MTSKLIVTIKFNGKEISSNLPAENIQSFEQAETIAMESIQSFIKKYKFNESLAQKILADSYWNEEDFQTIDLLENSTHSPEVYQQYQRYLQNKKISEAEAVKTAQEHVANFYDIVLQLEQVGYARKDALQIMEESPNRKKTVAQTLLVLGDKAYPLYDQEIARAKGFVERG